MLWIKRNLIFVIGLLVAVGLLVFAVMNLLDKSGQNQSVRAELEDQWAQLENFYSLSPFPGPTNIAAVLDDQKKLVEFIDASRKVFQPIPTARFSGEQGFKTELDKAIFQINAAAKAKGVFVPTNYYFSFQAQKSLIRFAPGSIEPMARQLAEIQAMCKVLFEAEIVRLEAVQRARVSDDDGAAATTGTFSDIIPENIINSPFASISPYRVTFTCFSANLAQVVDGFVNSSHGFIIKTIEVAPSALDFNVQSGGEPAEGMAPNPAPVPEMAAPAMDPNAPPPPVRTPTFRTRKGGPGGGRMQPPGFAPPPVAFGAPPAGQPGKAAVDKGGLITILNERPFRVSLLIQVITLK
jgi:hypothetical protein